MHDLKMQMEREIERYKEMAELYAGILKYAGLGESEILILSEAIDLEGETGISLSGIFDVEKSGSVRKFHRMALVAEKYLKDDRANRINLTRKSIILNELDKDETRNVLISHHVASCMTMLVPFLYLELFVE